MPCSVVTIVAALLCKKGHAPCPPYYFRHESRAKAVAVAVAAASRLCVVRLSPLCMSEVRYCLFVGVQYSR